MLSPRGSAASLASTVSEEKRRAREEGAVQPAVVVRLDHGVKLAAGPLAASTKGQDVREEPQRQSPGAVRAGRIARIDDRIDTAVIEVPDVGKKAPGPAVRDAGREREAHVAAEARQQVVSEAELKQIRELKARDLEVQRHEQAHASAGGAYAGSPSFEYVTGPDGVRYAVSGEVSIDASAVPNDPEATLEKATAVRQAALAPAEPSAQDRRVAAEASHLAAQARVELLQLRANENDNRENDGNRKDANIERTDPLRSSDSARRAEDGHDDKEIEDAEADEEDDVLTLFGESSNDHKDNETDVPPVRVEQRVSALDRFQQIYGYVSALTDQLTERSIRTSDAQQIQHFFNEFA
ncbi:MAG: putative metalloprotease CJM1_0395 family protein [Gammaproteobacteria bacterium]